MTRNDRWAWAGLIGGAILCLSFGFTLLSDAIRDRPFHWSYPLYFVLAFVWALRFLGNVMWLRRESPNTDTAD